MYRYYQRNWVKKNNVIDKKAPRGKYAVKHKQNSGMNYITVLDSKPVLVVSTAARVHYLQEVTVQMHDSKFTNSWEE